MLFPGIFVINPTTRLVVHKRENTRKYIYNFPLAVLWIVKYPKNVYLENHLLAELTRHNSKSELCQRWR